MIYRALTVTEESKIPMQLEKKKEDTIIGKKGTKL